ncbi:hypothetical protein GCM10022286_08330 [Gryllotalpicola daejeonensis]|uniref:Uncharacterized protein n=1 Tax=Gryllotalpicola daejeonensis TaxID=993087 RepID=A0ABP7ZGG6_9MICO
MTIAADRSRLAPRPVRELPPELLDVQLDVVHPDDEPDTGPSSELLLACSAIFAGVFSAALLAGELAVRLVGWRLW